MKIWTCLGQITLSKIDEVCPLAIPNQISISKQIPSLVKIYRHLLKLSSGNKNTDRHTTDGQTHGWPTSYFTTPPLSCRILLYPATILWCTIIPRHYCAAYHFTLPLSCGVPLNTAIIVWHTIIPGHYCVAYHYTLPLSMVYHYTPPLSCGIPLYTTTIMWLGIKTLC